MKIIRTLFVVALGMLGTTQWVQWADAHFETLGGITAAVGMIALIIGTVALAVYLSTPDPDSE